MKIIVGLGNPGPRYETTRHNAGFLAIDRLAERWKADGPSRKGEAEVFTGAFGGEKFTLVKPLTFMNESGRVVGPLCKFYKCTPGDLIVIHDELDLMPMAIRLKTGGGAGGHNGIKSIDAHLGAGQNNYHRVRIGVGHPAKVGSRLSPADYVLEQFTDKELKDLDSLLEDVADAVEQMVRGDVSGAMTKYNASNREK